MKYRKKPVVIDAVQVDTEHFIETLEGTMKASPGDWIITGVQGERYPCKPDIFEATYEPAELEAQTVTDEQIDRALTAFYNGPQHQNYNQYQMRNAMRRAIAALSTEGEKE